MIEFDLPWPPSVNHYWKPGARLPAIVALSKAPKDGRRLYHWLMKRTRGYLYLSTPGKAWRNKAIDILKRAYHGPPLTGLLQCRLDLYPPNGQTDFDNYNKPIFDALQHAGVYENDRQVRACLIVVNNIAPSGRVRLTIDKLGA